MNILITGGAGFIGSHLGERLLTDGHSVDVVDNMITGVAENILICKNKAKECADLGACFRFFEQDINSPDTRNLILDTKYDIVFHFAAQMDVRQSVKDPSFDARTNIMGSLNLLTASVETGVKRFIFASSGGTVYGNQKYFPADEDHILQPISPYGISKTSVELYLHYYHLNYGLSYAALRYGNVYGPRQNPKGEAGVVAIFAQKMLNGIQPIINGEGTQTRDYIFIQDVIRANYLAMNSHVSGNFNIGMGRETNVIEIFDLLNAQLGNKFKQEFGPEKPGEQLRSVIDCKKAKTLLGWKPEYTIEEGIKQTAKWFESNSGGRN